MNRGSRLIIVFIAYGLALLHTAVPHQHDKGSESRPVISHAGCIFHGSMGLLQMVLSTDLGTGHLETFKKSTEGDIAFSKVAVSAIFMVIPFAVLSGVLFKNADALQGYVERLHKRLLLFSSRHLRAPPLVI